MGKFIHFFGAAVLILVCAMVWTPPAEAYEFYLNGGDNCSTCHPGFTGGVSDSLHQLHVGFTGECLACHITTSGAKPVPTHFVDPPEPPVVPWVGCVGCHGRDPDTGAGDDWAAGLRLHHTISGITACAGCHPSDPLPLPEDMAPLYYGDSTITSQTDSCADNLDNDGDDLYDGEDPDCAANEPPVADPNGPYTGTVGVAVTFDGSGSSDADGTIVAYDWDFGDGNTGTGVGPSHTYAAAGTYTVTLTVTDDASDTDTASTTADIGEEANEPPVADPNGPYTGTVGVAVTFDGSGSSDADGTIVAYDWDFGDGNTGTGVGPTHTYTAMGTYTVTLTVTDDAGATDTASTTADIGEEANEPPVADPNGPYTGTVGVAVTFDGSGSSDADGTIGAYDWDFGDGNTGTGVGPTHTYTAMGTYTVTLTVTDDAGATDTASTTASIEPIAVIEVEIEVPGAINAINRGKTPIHIEFPDSEFPDSNGDTQVEIAELYCGGDVSDAGAMPQKINVEDDEENEFVALFKTLDLMLVCEDTMMVCVGTLADGTAFAGMDDLKVVRDARGRCGGWNNVKASLQP